MNTMIQILGAAIVTWITFICIVCFGIFMVLASIIVFFGNLFKALRKDEETSQPWSYDPLYHANEDRP